MAPCHLRQWRIEMCFQWTRSTTKSSRVANKSQELGSHNTTATSQLLKTPSTITTNLRLTSSPPKRLKPSWHVIQTSSSILLGRTKIKSNSSRLLTKPAVQTNCSRCTLLLLEMALSIIFRKKERRSETKPKFLTQWSKRKWMMI